MANRSRNERDGSTSSGEDNPATHQSEKTRASRRRSLKGIAAAGGVVAGSRTLDKWAKPVVDTVVLPAHGQISPAGCTGGSGFEQTASGNYTYTVPDGVTEIGIEARGGDGGGGGGGASANEFSGGGGGAGEEGAIETTVIAVAAGQVYNIAVGGGGQGGEAGTGETGEGSAGTGGFNAEGGTGESGSVGDGGGAGGGGGGAGGRSTVALEGGSGFAIEVCGGNAGGGGAGAGLESGGDNGDSGSAGGVGGAGAGGGGEGGDGGLTDCGGGSGSDGDGFGGDPGTDGGDGSDGRVTITECPSSVPG